VAPGGRPLSSTDTSAEPLRRADRTDCWAWTACWARASASAACRLAVAAGGGLATVTS